MARELGAVLITGAAASGAPPPSSTKGVQDTAARGIPPQRVARVVRRVLTRHHPGTRYRVGLDARLSLAISRLLGDRLFDRVVARVMKIPSEPPA